MEKKESIGAQSFNEKLLRLLTFIGKMLIAYNFSYFGAISSALILWIEIMSTIYMWWCWTLKKKKHKTSSFHLQQLTITKNKASKINEQHMPPNIPEWIWISRGCSFPHHLSWRIPLPLCCERETPRRAERTRRSKALRREEEADPAGEGRQMETDGGRDLEMKRNTPLGVTEEGVRGRGMRGLQAWEGKKWSL